MNPRPKLGEMLIKAGLITPADLDKCIDSQKATGKKLGTCIVEFGLLTDETMTNFLAKQQNLPVVNLDEIFLPENLIRKFPRKTLEKHFVIPLSLKEDVLTLAISDPTDFEAINDIQLATDYRVELALAPQKAIKKSIESFYAHLDTFVPPHHAGSGKPGPVAAQHSPSKTELIRSIEDEIEKVMPIEEDAGAGLNEFFEQVKKLNLTPIQIQNTLIALLIRKGAFTREEFLRKAREISTP